MLNIEQEIEKYFKRTAQNFSGIQTDERILNGMPAIKNTRIPVSLILACLKDEMTFQEICEEYQLKQEDIEMAMEYVIELLNVPYQEGGGMKVLLDENITQKSIPVLEKYGHDVIHVLNNRASGLVQ